MSDPTETPKPPDLRRYQIAVVLMYTIKVLALPLLSGHPDYREEWRP